MFKDKNPVKWIILGALFIIVMIALFVFYGLSAKAADDKFLPIKEIKTPAGISVWAVEDNSLPVVAVQFMFRDSGTANDPENMQGLVRMLSNTLDEGAGDLDSQGFQKALSDHSITLFFSAGRDSFGGRLKTLTRHQDKAFELLALAINEPRFDEEPVARMRDANMTRIRSSLSDPEWMAARLMNDKAHESHPYGKNSGGTISSLAKITPDDLRDFKNKYLTRDRLLIAVAGDIDPNTLGPAIDKAFGKLPATSDVPAIADTGMTNGGKIFVYEQDIPQTIVQSSLPAFNRTDKDYYALQMLNYIYGGGGFGSRLMDTAREQKGLTYGIYSSVQNNRHADILAVSTSTANANAKEILSIIRDEMTRMRDEPVSEKELEDAKSYIIGSMPLSLSSTDNIAAMVLGLRADDLPIDYLDHYAEYMRAVTTGDIQRVAKRVLTPENMVTVFVGKPENIDTAEIIKELPNVQ